jgi:hypothetical protein
LIRLLYLVPVAFVAAFVWIMWIGISGSRQVARSRNAFKQVMARRAAEVRTARPGPTELGALVSVFPIAQRRQRRIAIWATLIGLSSLVVLAGVTYLALRPSDQPHVVPVGALGGMGGLAVLAFGGGILAGSRSLRHRGEEFRVHEGGIVHADSRGSQTVAWRDITDVSIRYAANRVQELLGRDVVITVSVRSGERVVIPGLTEQAATLYETICRAVYQGDYPSLTD